MSIDVDKYRKRWPFGLVTYPAAIATGLPSGTIAFLLSVGLPRGREPEWAFDGQLAANAHGLQFGAHGFSPLVITASGSVLKIFDGKPIYVNSNVERFAECLTLRKQPYGLGREMTKAIELRRAFEMVDPTAVSSDALWGKYLIECEEEECDTKD